VLPKKVNSSARDLVRDPLAQAFLISLLLHFVVFGAIEAGRGLNLWKFSLLPKWMQSRLYEEVRKEEERRLQQAQQKQPESEDVPLVFVEIDPSQATEAPPKDSKFYSTQNTLASNPNPEEKPNPKIDGQQEKVVKTFDVLRPDPKAQSAPPKPEKKPEPEPEPAQPAQAAPAPTLAPKPEPKTEPEPEPREEPPTRKPGDLLVARATPKTQPFQSDLTPQAEPKRPRPRTVAEAKIQKGILSGEKMKQAGGARRNSLQSNLDVRSSPFGSYDAAFIAAVQARWYSLLEEREFVGNQSGKVALEFRLNKDGRITNLRVGETEVTEMLSWLCERAVLDPAPYAPFPPDLRALLKNDYREIRFTFIYNQ
jgi:hypothetical protein